MPLNKKDLKTPRNIPKMEKKAKKFEIVATPMIQSKKRKTGKAMTLDSGID